MGLYNAQDVEPLTTWLIKNLDAISDAEPSALAKYIIELLHMWTNDPESEVRPRLVEELSDFLQTEASPFTDRLLAALRSKSYLPYTTVSGPPSNQNFNRGQDKQSRGRKRGLEQDEQEINRERDLKGPPKGPRIQNERHMRRGQDGPRSHSLRPNDRDEGRSRERPQQLDGRDSRSDYGPNPPAGPGNQRERCRDYYEFGFCNRGAACPYSHGEDAMMANPLPFPPAIPPAMAMQMLNGLLPPGFPNPFMGPGMVPPAPYDPSQVGMGMPGQFNGGAYGNGIQDLTPHGSRNNRPPIHQNMGPMPPQMQTEDATMGEMQPSGLPNDAPMHHERHSSRGRGFARGGRPDHIRRSNVADPNSLTIVVEKLPPEKTNITDLSAWFSKFGTVTNVGVDSRGNRALVSFASHDEAVKAWKSEEAVFGNRFVVIFWHRPAPGGGAAGQRALEASAKVVKKLNESGEDIDMADEVAKSEMNGHRNLDSMDVSMGGVPAPTPAKKVEPKTPQEIFEYASRVWMEKMKGIMDVMQSTTSTEAEKTEAKAKFKVLKSQKPQPPGAAPTPAATASGLEKKGSVDLDLDMLASGEGQNLTQEEAQQALARLQELAAERGLDPNNMEEDGSRSYNAGYRGAPTRRGWRGGYRGRGRGRGAFAMASASLDNRTKKVVLVGYEKAGVGDDSALDIVQSFYLPTGQAEEVHKGDGGIVVAFSTRQAAELALRAGAPSIEGLPPLSMQWYNTPSTQQKNDATTDNASMADASEGPVDKTSIAKRPVRGDEEEEDHEWDDEDGGRRPR